jgi:dTDP-4-dehydrorhamnose reductase
VRSVESHGFFKGILKNNILTGVDAGNFDSLITAFSISRPQIVINCIGLVKQLAEVDDPLVVIPINALFPHQLSNLCDALGARLIHMSTDCVFKGTKGMYMESDFADADDLYGRTKLIGEVYGDTSVTLRTSLIGYEINSMRSLIGWFLAQENAVKGYTKAIFSGLPTIEIAKLIGDLVIPNEDLRGLYHISADPIDKFSLLNLVKKEHQKNIAIVPDETITIDRSLNSSKFRSATGFRPAPWPELIKSMHQFG